jgi:hypothetical protein
LETIEKDRAETMRILFLILLIPLLWGCSSTPEIVVQDEDAMLYLDPFLRPDIYLFPDYLFMEDFEIDQHGRIPETTLVGIDLKTDLAVKVVLRQFNNVLANNGWIISKAEIAKQSFRLLADMKDETLEVRAVQGSGPTQVFVLYQSSSEEGR